MNEVSTDRENTNEDEEAIVSTLSSKLEEAEDDAKKLGEIIGRITRYQTVRIGERDLVGIDITFKDYINSNITRGQYLGIRGITRAIVMIGQVYSISRADTLARLGIRELSYPKDPTTIITTTFIELKPIAEMEKNGNKEILRPAVSPIDPQSPVFIPKPEVLEKILRIPKEGITIGKIFSGGEEIEAKVRLDEETLNHHVLILGTTGSGKTTLLKNIVSNKEEIKKQTLVFDRQGDFINYLIERNDKDSFAVLMPVSEKPNRKVSIKDYAEDFADFYGCEVLYEEKDGVYVNCNNHEVFVVPYSINFFDNFKSFNKITPYFTQKASIYWDGIVSYFFDRLGYELHELTNTYIGETEISSLLRNRLRPADLVGDKTTIKIESIPPNIKIVKNAKKEHVDYSKGVLEIYTGKLFSDAMRSLDLAPNTQEAIIRTLKAYDSYKIFTVLGTVDFKPEKLFSDPEKNVIVDLSWIMNSSTSIEAVATVSYKILEDVFSWKDKLYLEKRKKVRQIGEEGKRRSINSNSELPLTLIIMDEAHEYFPQTNQENVSKDIVEGLINKIMRLGRVRNIGVILATHVPEDLNPLVLQLSNTKIAMRNDPHVLRAVGMEDYIDFLTQATPGLGIINSLTFSGIPIKTVLPR
ncbi:DUF87 domain-containing protein [Acidianus sulfidivorans JP7]|uniref:ATP-binding protein n=1 Tax=Acidianus sulfidivorans JP7 TaxID=619593 RepID=A0A2U9IJG7_9CREN|nr:ATP-binding protein [Acidianus sulfidivorans]AWR96160.1 DUF87 domain-containing protein [Acidianus sulfidivorans JP7]